MLGNSRRRARHLGCVLSSLPFIKTILRHIDYGTSRLASHEVPAHAEVSQWTSQVRTIFTPSSASIHWFPPQISNYSPLLLRLLYFPLSHFVPLNSEQVCFILSSPSLFCDCALYYPLYFSLIGPHDGSILYLCFH